MLESLLRARLAGGPNAYGDPSICLPNTSTTSLEGIITWILDSDPSAPPFYWLHGLAGTGKTTLAHTICEVSRNRCLSLVGSSFFFSGRGEAELRNPRIVFPTLAYQLARFNNEFSARITAALEQVPNAPYMSLEQQLRKLIVEPLSGLSRDPDRVVVILFDAFDECENSGAKEILRVLVAAIPRLPFFIKIFITSRAEVHIRSVLAPASGIAISALHNIEKTDTRSDIRLRLQSSLQALPKEKDISLPADWVKEEDIDSTLR